MNVYGLIGSPLGHSFSKKYFDEKFEKEQLDEYRFELYPLENIAALPLLLRSEANLKGLAVTIPYKESVLRYVDVVDQQAIAIGAVNCIKISVGKLIGYNTDSIGFERSLKPLLKSHHTKALVLGSGGSSKAVQYVLQKLGIAYLIVSRNKPIQKEFIQYDLLDESIMNQHTLIINCSPVGMFPNEQEQPVIPYHFLTKDHLLFDLIYRPEQTRFLSQGLSHGSTIKNGYEMLVLQAEENWKIWSGK